MNGMQPFDDYYRRVGSSPDAQLGRVRLELPSEKHIDSFFGAMAEFESEGDHQYSKVMTREEFPAYVQQLHDKAEGKNLKEGHIPDKEFWIIDSDGFAGRIILGLAFYPDPDRVGNHVGYAVRPSRRGKGYATKALRLLLDEARKLNIKKLMPICDAANIASRKVIERNGGVLIVSPPNDPDRFGGLRFVIDLDERC